MMTLAVDREPLHALQPCQAVEGCRILVVEDDAAFGDVLDTTLRARGYEILRATTVTEGRALLASEGAVDLVLTDQRLPHALGYQLLYAEELIWTNTPVLIMTAFPSDSLRFFLGSMGVPLLEKPFSMERLVASVLDLVLVHVREPEAEWTFRSDGAS